MSVEVLLVKYNEGNLIKPREITYKAINNLNELKDAMKGTTIVLPYQMILQTVMEAERIKKL